MDHFEIIDNLPHHWNELLGQLKLLRTIPTADIDPILLREMVNGHYLKIKPSTFGEIALLTKRGRTTVGQKPNHILNASTIDNATALYLAYIYLGRPPIIKSIPPSALLIHYNGAATLLLASLSGVSTKTVSRWQKRHPGPIVIVHPNPPKKAHLPQTHYHQAPWSRNEPRPDHHD